MALSTAQFDLTLQVSTGDAFSGGLLYSCDLFRAETAARMVEHYKASPVMLAAVDLAVRVCVRLPCRHWLPGRHCMWGQGTGRTWCELKGTSSPEVMALCCFLP